MGANSEPGPNLRHRSTVVGKSKPGRITKSGDSYQRMLLVQGAHSVLIDAEKRTDSFSRWVCSLVERR